MDAQFSTIDLQMIDLRKKLDDKQSAILVQQQTDHLKEWANHYLANMANGLQISDVNTPDLDEIQTEDLYNAVAAL